MARRLTVWVQPGASRDRVVGLHGEAVKVAVAAPPEKGRANQAVARLLAAAMGLRKSAVRVVAGAAARQKVIEIDGVSAARLAEFIAAWRRAGAAS